MVEETKTMGANLSSEGGGGRAFAVRPSRVRTGGTSRIHESALTDLGVNKGDLVEVESGGRRLALHLYGDAHVAPDQIVLRPPDMKRLGVGAGASVTVRPYARGWEAVRGAARRFGTGLSERFDLADRPTEEAP